MGAGAKRMDVRSAAHLAILVPLMVVALLRAENLGEPFLAVVLSNTLAQSAAWAY